MKARFLLATALLLAAGQQVLAQATNTTVIMYIGDGFGLAPKTAARMALGQGRDGKRYATDAGFQVLNLDKLKYNATVTTHSLNSWITDSAPGASVYACGKPGKQDNEVIALNPGSGAAIETILEAAKKQGYAVGLVSTARITHATPAAFASHIWFRDLEDYIAAQYIASTQAQYEAIFNASPTASFKYQAARDWVLPAPKVGVELDVVLGGGARHFMPRTRTAASDYETVKDASGTPIGASHMWATARDWARLGLFYMDDGVVGRERLLPEGWIDYSTRLTPGSDFVGYGAQFWTNRGGSSGARNRPHMPADSFMARGAHGQYTIVIPSKRLVVVRLGDAYTRLDDIAAVDRRVGEVIVATGG